MVVVVGGGGGGTLLSLLDAIADIAIKSDDTILVHFLVLYH